MTLSAQIGGGNMSEKIYSGVVKRIQSSDFGKQRVFLYVDGIGEAIIAWGKSKPGELSNGAKVEVCLKEHDDGRWMVSKIVSIKQTTRAKLKANLKQKLRGPRGFLQRLFLVAMGGSKSNFSALESRAESLEPFIEYVEHSKEAYRHLQQTARFKWEPVENEKYIIVTKQLGSKIRVRSETLPYVLKEGPVEAIQEGAQLMHPKGQVAEIMTVRSNSTGVDFSTSRDLNSKGWMVFGGKHSMEQIEFEHNNNSKPIEKITSGSREIKILTQSKKGEWIELALDLEPKEMKNKQLLIDGREMEWESISQSDFVGPLSDVGSGRQIISGAKLNQAETVRYIPTGEFLYDSDGVRYKFKKTTKAGDSLKLRLRLHEDIEKRLDDDRDTNPMDILFSPDSVYNELIVDFNRQTKIKDLKKLNILSRDVNSKTITIAKPMHKRRPFNLGKDATLSLQPNLFYIERQLEMLQILRDYPLPHHDALLRLTEKGSEDKRNKLWETFELEDEPEWEVLTRDTDGTLDQRDFVRKAISTPDFAILQGPPGSGKTTAIIELIAQLTRQGKKVLLCGSTQASVDNVLLRIKDNERLHHLVSPLRIGNKERIYDSGIHDVVLSERIQRLMEIGLSEEESQDLILRQTNLTCGTMEGIINHPWIRDSKFDQGRNLKTPQPHFDVLIVDEASKTTFQQFIIPAAFSRKWVLVGDVRQLPPFLEASELMTNLEMMKDSEGNPFTNSSQRASLILRNLSKYNSPKSGHPIVMIEGEGVPSSFIIEANSWNERSFKNCQISIIGRNNEKSEHTIIQSFTPEEISDSAKANIFLHSSHIIIVGSDCYPEIAELLPIHSIIRNGTIDTEEVTVNRMALYQERQSEKFFASNHPMHKDNLLTEWTYQISWRLNRSYELKTSNNELQKTRLDAQINEYLPKSQDIRKRLEEVRSIALPSVLECLQFGFATGKAQQLLPETTLTQGFPEKTLLSRFSRINFQHRMHPDISSFSRKEFYDNEALIDANTLQLRDESFPFNYRYGKSRKTWIDVPAELRPYTVNREEVNAIKNELKLFIEDSRNKPPSDPRRDNPTQWEIAVLSPYQRQRKALVAMVQELTGLEHSMRFNLAEMEKPAPITIIVSTTDRFQGQEADIVFISLRNSGKIGFLDSPNRINVAITRAREWRVIVGNWDYFARHKAMKDPMLRSLAQTHSKHKQLRGK